MKKEIAFITQKKFRFYVVYGHNFKECYTFDYN